MSNVPTETFLQFQTNQGKSLKSKKDTTTLCLIQVLVVIKPTFIMQLHLNH